jgi:hypothetical protein
MFVFIFYQKLLQMSRNISLILKLFKYYKNKKHQFTPSLKLSIFEEGVLLAEMIDREYR